MSINELANKYLQLRSALENAYGQPVWDSARIDELTDEIASTERALSESGAGAVPLCSLTSRVSAQAAGAAAARV